eukprot:c16602_g1_i4.p1 GENE.c16602_g1_i4~~c16602_g1_i4.p1  ORF type:complete len:307 (-),score=44.63 c16602_g1_i4:40-960(-)
MSEGDRATSNALHEAEAHRKSLAGYQVDGQVTIFATPASAVSDPSALRPNAKLVHFIRHGQGPHNVAGMNSEHQCDCHVSSPPSGLCPYLDPVLIDSRLTQLGRTQATALRPVSVSLPQPDSGLLVVVSPLRRAVETAVLALCDLDVASAENNEASTYGPLVSTDATTSPPLVTLFASVSGLKVPFIAHPGAQELSGLHVCDLRVPRSELEALFPFVDVSLISETDTLWTPEHRELHQSCAQRGYEFMNWLNTRSEREVFVATHSAWLFVLFNAVVQCEDAAYHQWFRVGEMRSVWVEWADRQNDS